MEQILHFSWLSLPPPGERYRNAQENHSSYPSLGRLRDHVRWSPVCTNWSAIRRVSPKENALLHLLLLRLLLFLFRHRRGHHKHSGRPAEAKLGVAERGNETIRHRLSNIEGAASCTFRDSYFFDLYCLFHTECYHTGDRSCVPKIWHSWPLLGQSLKTRVRFLHAVSNRQFHSQYSCLLPDEYEVSRSFWWSLSQNDYVKWVDSFRQWQRREIVLSILISSY